MAQIIKLTNHSSMIQAPSINKICRPLFEKTSITYFCYMRRYRSGYFTFLPTIIDFGEYLIGGGLYPHTWFGGLPFDSLTSGFSIWDVAKQISTPEAEKIGIEVAKSFKLIAGIDIIEKHDEYIDIYCFASTTPAMYLTSIPYLYQFIYYLKQQAHTILLDAYQDKFKLINLGLVEKKVPILHTPFSIQSDLNDFPVKRYYLSGRYEKIFLTQREVGILRGLETGLPIKCLADTMCISTRTLENHITNIKNKLEVSRATELMHIARVNNLIF